MGRCGRVRQRCAGRERGGSGHDGFAEAVRLDELRRHFVHALVRVEQNGAIARGLAFLWPRRVGVELAADPELRVLLVRHGCVAFGGVGEVAAGHKLALLRDAVQRHGGTCVD